MGDEWGATDKVLIFGGLRQSKTGSSNSRFGLLYVKILKDVILTTQGEESGQFQTPIFNA
jgi:hypothetical protein